MGYTNSVVLGRVSQGHSYSLGSEGKSYNEVAVRDPG